MAIDTEDKRRSVQAYTLSLMRPSPDGSMSKGDRATLAWLYSGLNYVEQVIAATVVQVLIASERMSQILLLEGDSPSIVISHEHSSENVIVPE